MSCYEVQKNLLGYLDEELTHEESASVRGHLNHCAVCSGKLKEFETLRATVGKNRSLPEEVFFDDMRRLLFREIREASPSKEVAFPFRLKRWMPIVVPVTLSLLLAGLWILPGRLRGVSVKQDLSELATLETANGDISSNLNPGEIEGLEEELAMNDSFSEGDLQQEIDILNALEEGEGLTEEEMDELEQELATYDEAAAV